MKWKRWLALGLAVVLSLSWSACKGKEKEKTEESSSSQVEQEDPNYPVAIDDIRVDKRPEQAVSLSPALTEIIYELDSASQLAGVSDYCDYPEGAKDKTPCGTAALPNWDALEELQPDVVFASAPLSQENTIRLQQMEAEVVVLPPAEDLDELEQIYITIGSILGGKVDGKYQAKTLFASLREGYEALEAAGQKVDTPLGAIYLRAAPLTVATGDTFEGALLEMLGLENDGADYTGWEYPADQAANLYPDLIFYDQSIDPEYFQSTQIYNTTDAYKNGRLYPVDGTVFERQSTRMLNTLIEMFQEAYPEIEIDFDGTAQEEPQEESEDEEQSSSQEDEDDELLQLEDATQIQE